MYGQGGRAAWIRHCRTLSGPAPRPFAWNVIKYDHLACLVSLPAACEGKSFLGWGLGSGREGCPVRAQKPRLLGGTEVLSRGMCAAGCSQESAWAQKVAWTGHPSHPDPSCPVFPGCKTGACGRGWSLPAGTLVESCLGPPRECALTSGHQGETPALVLPRQRMGRSDPGWGHRKWFSGAWDPRGSRSGNWRLTFSVNADGEFDEVDYEDYH